MKKKSILLIAWAVYSYTILFYTTVMFILGKADTMDKIYMFLCYSILLLMAINKIIRAICQYKSYKTYKNGIKYLQFIHATRYKLCFTGTREAVKEYSRKLEEYGTQFINNGREAVSQNLFNKKQTEHLKEMINQAEILMTTEQSNIRGA